MLQVQPIILPSEKTNCTNQAVLTVLASRAINGVLTPALTLQLSPTFGRVVLAGASTPA